MTSQIVDFVVQHWPWIGGALLAKTIKDAEKISESYKKHIKPRVGKVVAVARLWRATGGSFTYSQSSNTLLDGAWVRLSDAESKAKRPKDRELLGEIRGVMSRCNTRRDVYLLWHTIAAISTCRPRTLATLTVDDDGLWAFAVEGTDPKYRGFRGTTRTESDRVIALLTSNNIAARLEHGWSVSKSAHDRMFAILGDSGQTSFITADKWDEAGYVPIGVRAPE